VNHIWTPVSTVHFVAREVSYRDAFRGEAQLHRYSGDHRRLAYGAVIHFDGLTPKQESSLIVEASGDVADVILKAAGLRPIAKLAGSSVIGVDLGGPIGETGDIAGMRSARIWRLAFFRR
jgi:hypothetical protein